MPQGKYKVLPTERTKVSSYPVALIPGQFQEYYKRYLLLLSAFLLGVGEGLQSPVPCPEMLGEVCPSASCGSMVKSTFPRERERPLLKPPLPISCPPVRASVDRCPSLLAPASLEHAAWPRSTLSLASLLGIRTPRHDPRPADLVAACLRLPVGQHRWSVRGTGGVRSPWPGCHFHSSEQECCFSLIPDLDVTEKEANTGSFCLRISALTLALNLMLFRIETVLYRI